MIRQLFGELLALVRRVATSLDALVDEQRATRKAVEAQQEQYISWSQALRRIGGNADDAEAALERALKEGRIRSYTVMSTRRRRIWTADLANLVPPRQPGRSPKRQRGKYRLE